MSMIDKKTDFKLFKTNRRTGIYLFIVSIFLFFLFSYIGGGSLPSVQRFERLMELDYLEKSQPTVSFVHADIFSGENDSFNFFRTKQSLYYGYSNKGSSYIVCGKGRSTDFTSNIYGCSYEKLNLITVNAFSDTNMMEYIPLPLYKTLGKNEISNVDKNIYLSGVYISLDLADELIECKTNNIDSYEDFFDANNPVVVPIIREGGEYLLVVKNIFLTRYVDEAESWTHEEYLKYTQKYNAYNVYFSVWNKYSLFISDSHLFNKYGCHLSTDVRNNYANMRNYIERIFDGDFSINNCKLDIFVEASDKSFVNANDKLKLDYYYSKHSEASIKTVLLITCSMVFGTLFVWIGMCVYKAQSDNKSKKIKITYLCSISFGSFVIYQLLSYFLCYFVSDYLIYLLITNIFGNILTLLASLLLFSLNIVHTKRGDAHE